MSEHPRLRNVAVLIILAAIYAIPAMFFNGQRMMDIVSGPMLVFGLYTFILVLREAWGAFWQGRGDRTAYALFGLSLLFFSVDIMRSYGLSTRNLADKEMFAPFIAWLENESHVYAIAIYMQFVGIWIFTRASFQTSVTPRRSGVGQLVAGVIIGAVIASSKVLEPVLMFVSKLFSRIF